MGARMNKYRCVIYFEYQSLEKKREYNGRTVFLLHSLEKEKEEEKKMNCLFSKRSEGGHEEESDLICLNILIKNKSSIEFLSHAA